MAGPLTTQVDRLGRAALRRVTWVPAATRLILLTLSTPVWRNRATRRVQLDLARRQVLFTGLHALPMVTMIAFVVGCTLIIESLPTVPKIGAESMLGTIWVHAIVREFGPLLAGLIVTGRSGGAVAADLGCMKAGGEVAALRAMAIDPFTMLIVPRILGMTAATVALTVYLIFFTIGAGVAVALTAPWITGDVLVHALLKALELEDLGLALLKGLLFGLAISSIACQRGLAVTQAITDVPLAVGTTVVRCILAIVLLDGLLSLMWLL